MSLILHCGAGAVGGQASASGSLLLLLLLRTQCALPQLTFHDPPGVQPSPDSLPLGLHHSVAADHSEGRAFLGKGSKDPAQASPAL